MRSSPSRADRLAALIERPFAHRGVHGPGVPENSRAAFKAAIDRGFGIELDVQASRDGEAMVFHDDDLVRLAGLPAPVCGMVAAELERMRLEGSEERIPSLAGTLELVAGRVPLLIEVKAPARRVAALGRAVARALEDYEGAAAVMSFNPEVGSWFARSAPERLRGLVVSEEGRPERGRLRRRLSLWRARPDFLAYDIGDLPSRFAAAQRARGLPVLTWTVRNPAERDRAALAADQIIFEEPA